MKHLPQLVSRLQDAWGQRWAAGQLREAVLRLIRQEHFDLVLFQGRRISILDNVSLPIAIDCGDAECARYLQQMHHSSVRRLPAIAFRYLVARRREKKLARRTPFCSFISERDRTAILGPDDKSNIVPQGVDYVYWKRKSPRPNENSIVFSGVMNYAPNFDAALFLLREILPRVRTVIPKLKVTIVGRDPLPELLRVAREYPDVTVTGATSDIRPHLEQADIYVAALRFASGVQNKVLEAMAMQIPVVTTPVVLAGLCTAGCQPPLLIGNNARQISDAVISLLSDPEGRECLATKARTFVETHCSWSESAYKLEQICLAAAGRQQVAA